MASKKTKKTEGQGNFMWSDDEIELLLAVIYEYKTTKESEGFDWESIKAKYENIRALFLARYPQNQDANDQREFKRKDPSNDFTKERIVAKIKALRLKYRVALDSGRRSGGGRVVAQFYDICSKIWSGSPAAEAIEGGVDSSSFTSANTSTDAMSPDETSNPSQAANLSDVMSSDEGESTQAPDHHRRDLVRHLQESRNAKLKKRIPVDKQILDITKKDFELKREMMEHMKYMEAEHQKQMKTLSESMVGLTNALTAAISGRQYQNPSGQFQQPVQAGVIQGAQYPQPVQTGT